MVAYSNNHKLPSFLSFVNNEKETARIKTRDWPNSAKEEQVTNRIKSSF